MRVNVHELKYAYAKKAFWLFRELCLVGLRLAIPTERHFVTQNSYCVWVELAFGHQQFYVPPRRACFSTITTLFSGYETNAQQFTVTSPALEFELRYLTGVNKIILF